MKKTLIASFALALAATPLRAGDDLELKTQPDKVSYAIGLSMGSDFKRQGVEINADALTAGLKSALSGGKALLTDDERREILLTWQKDQMERMTAKMKELGDKNKVVGDKFLADNKGKEGVKTLPNGIQYKVLKEGTGAVPKPTDTVKTHYRGTLVDGTEFDSSLKDNEPAIFVVNEVIKGWSEVLPLMKVGSKWQVVVPSDLAYGERGAGRDIGPNSTLIFEIELLGIES